MRPSHHGFLILDKPAGLTSRDVVNRVQRWFPRGTRIGHTGTLDPSATGVLVIGVGQATRLTEYVQDMDKTYESVFRLGERSDTDDADGTVVAVPDAPIPNRETLVNALAGFVGASEQIPPAFSAAKVSGRRAYDLARKGHAVALAARRIEIYGIDVLAYDYPRLRVEVRCGKGTYIRSLARDLGNRLKCGALVEGLRRTAIGPFTVSAAINLEVAPESGRSHLLPVAAAVARLPQISLGNSDVVRLRQGKTIALSSLPAIAESQDIAIAVFSEDNQLMAIGKLNQAERSLIPRKVLAWQHPAGSVDPSSR